MKNTAVNLSTGISGIVMYLLVLLEIPFYFFYTPAADGTTPVNIVLIRILIDLFICIGLIGFFSGFRTIVACAKPEVEWIAALMSALGMAFSIVALVADSIQVGSVWAAGTKTINPTWVGAGAEGALLIYGPINRLLNSLILFAGSTLVLKSRLFPKWTAGFGYFSCLYNLLFIPTMFYMTTPLDFYSTNGWNIPIAASFFFLWIFIISIYLLRNKPASQQSPSPAV
ncbi:hypothetical protein GS399_00955 [Pedobacter sp. HMF7647]|uniref:DUF4386 family protein n=1 Tax=Hufsiella arboris TaxID=2695275 RepID=A0A7K1Y4M8_9SPHI|nr:hypothetical protein [Hufsiella arboris]MXV49524.1 hypothetical protein [Hufsiella arboris]